MIPQREDAEHRSSQSAYEIPTDQLILIIDDHPLFVEGLQRVVEIMRPNTRFVHAHNLAQAELLIEEYPNLDLILLDLKLPDGEGLTFLKTLRDKQVYAPCVVLSASEKRSDVRYSLQAGASGFISKADSGHVIMEQIDKVMAGDIVQPQYMLTESDSSELEISLTPRQQEILELLSEGLSNKAICLKLGISEHTIKSHIKTLYVNLNAHSRTECVNIARTLGLLS